MDKEKIDKAVSILNEIDWLERNVDGRMTLPEKIDNYRAAEAVIVNLWSLYENEISDFCQNLVKRYRHERVERIAQLKAEFDAL